MASIFNRRRIAKAIFSAVGLGVWMTVASASLAQPQPSGLQWAAAMEQTLVDVIGRCEPSVVAIARFRADHDAAARWSRGRLDLRELSHPTLGPADPDFIPHEYGTGVVIDPQGLILTQYHLLRDGDFHWVTTSDRKVYEARIKAADPRSGLAVLSVDASRMVPIRFGDAAQLRKGQIVVALGNPYAIARDGQASASWGIISNLGRNASPIAADHFSTEKPTLHHFGTLIQTDAKLSLGTSGGALINLRGEMVGLTTSVAAIAGYEQSAGYAVPIDDAFRRVVEILKEGREVEYGLLGVRSENLPSDTEPGRHGMLVAGIVEGTPAFQAGLKPMDIITHVNDQPIGSADELVLKVGTLLAATPVALTVLRDGKVRQFEVQLAKYPVDGTKIVTNQPPRWRGVNVDYVTALSPSSYQLHLRHGEVDLDGCVVITDVEQDSIAWQEGLRPKMFISHVGERRVTNPNEFRQAVAGKNGPVRLRLTVPDDQQPERTIPAE